MNDKKMVSALKEIMSLLDSRIDTEYTDKERYAYLVAKDTLLCIGETLP